MVSDCSFLGGTLFAQAKEFWGIVTELEGEAYFKQHANCNWTVLKYGDSLFYNYFIKTGENTRATIHLIDDSIIKIKENSSIQLSGEAQEKSLFAMILNWPSAQ